MDLRDPIWQGLEAVITIAGILLTAIFVLVPDFREWLLRTVRSSRFLLVLSLMIVSCLCLTILLPTTRGVLSLLATPTPTPTAIPTLTPIPTPTAEPPPVYTYLFDDNFDNGARPEWMPISGVWQMVNNKYTITNVTSETEWTSGMSFVGNPAWTDYQVGAIVNLENYKARINRALFIVRAQDTNNFLALELNDYDFLDSNWSKGTWYIVQNGQYTEMPAASFPISPITSFYVEIHLQQDIITTFIEGKQVSRWSGAPYLSGMAGLGVASRYPTSPTSFDNFFVRTQP